MAEKPDFEGIILYDVGLDGCLNGVYTNVPERGEIYNEIVRKIKSENWPNNIEGNYDCLWFDGNNQRETTCVLIVTANPRGSRIFEFVWQEQNGGSPRFKGIGYRMNERQIAVRYSPVP